MYLLRPVLLLTSILAAAQPAFGRIMDNTLPRPPVEVDTKLSVSLLDSKAPEAAAWKTYKPNANELSYLGRWDKKYISWWSAPGLKFGFTGEKVAISFGNYTSPGTLIAYRVGGLDWQFTNVTAGGTHQLVSSRSLATDLKKPQVFELRVTNWAYGVQIAGVHVDKRSKIAKVKPFERRIEFIGDSLSSGMYASYEGLSSFAFLTGYGLGNTEFAVTAYPGICVSDQDCWGNPRGQVFQWGYTQDGNVRQQEIYGLKPEPWDFKDHPAADLVVINIGTNDNNTHNQVATETYVSSYQQLIKNINTVWPKAQIICMGLWGGFGEDGESYRQNPAFLEEIPYIVNSFKGKGKGGKDFVHYFDTTGILQHNDIGPGTWHPTDIGQLKVAAHLQQYIKIKFGWGIQSTGPMVHSGTYIYNDECCY